MYLSFPLSSLFPISNLLARLDSKTLTRNRNRIFTSSYPLLWDFRYSWIRHSGVKLYILHECRCPCSRMTISHHECLPPRDIDSRQDRDHKYAAEMLLYQQVTRGHNIVADGWAGASNPHPHPNPPPPLKHTPNKSKTLVFPLFKWRRLYEFISKHLHV